MDDNLKMGTDEPHIYALERPIELPHLIIDSVKDLPMIILVVRKHLGKVSRILFQSFDWLPHRDRIARG